MYLINYLRKTSDTVYLSSVNLLSVFQSIFFLMLTIYTFAMKYWYLHL